MSKSMTTPDESTPRPYEAFGKHLDDALKRSKIERKRLAIELGVDVSMISHYCRGRELPNREALQVILGLVRKKLRTPLVDAYLTFDLPPPSESFFQEPHTEFIEQIQELIDSGCTYQAFDSASMLLQETLDPEVARILEDIVFELHLRMGEWGEAMILAHSIAAKSDSDPVGCELTLMRAACMKAIAYRSMRKYGEAGAQLKQVLYLDPSAGKFSSICTSSGSYLETLRRELVLTPLGGASADARTQVAKDKLNQLERWVEHATTPQGKWLLLEAAAQCRLALLDPGGVEEILAELLPKIESGRANEERYRILEGRWFALKGQWASALASLRSAYRRATEMENLHHANVAQRLMLVFASRAN